MSHRSPLHDARQRDRVATVALELWEESAPAWTQEQDPDSRRRACNSRAAIAIVTGTFDVLPREHARELEEARTGAAALLVIVLPRPANCFPACPRRTGGGLRVVDFVVEAGPRSGRLHSCARPERAVYLEEADERRSQQLRSTFWRGPKQELTAETQRRGDRRGEHPKTVLFSFFSARISAPPRLRGELRSYCPDTTIPRDRTEEVEGFIHALGPERAVYLERPTSAAPSIAGARSGAGQTGAHRGDAETRR